jgi:hypothetical protein
MTPSEKELMGRLAHGLKSMLDRNTSQADWPEYQRGKQAVQDFIQLMTELPEPPGWKEILGTRHGKEL